MTLTTMYNPWEAGVPAMPSVEPHPLMTVPPKSRRLTFIERLQSFIVYFGATFVLPTIGLKIKDSSKFVPEKEVKTLTSLYSQSEMFLVNIETNCFDFPRISAPHFRYISGVSAKPPAPLPQSIEDFISDAEHGVVVVSFGSLQAIRKCIPFIMDKLLEAFGKLQQKVIFGYDTDKLDKYEVPSNVLILDWLPQNDLLGHNQTNLFITHGGILYITLSVIYSLPFRL